MNRSEGNTDVCEVDHFSITVRLADCNRFSGEPLQEIAFFSECYPRPV